MCTEPFFGVAAGNVQWKKDGSNFVTLYQYDIHAVFRDLSQSENPQKNPTDDPEYSLIIQS